MLTHRDLRYLSCVCNHIVTEDKVLCKTNSVQNKHNLYYKRIFRCIRGPAKSQMTFDLQTILVQDQTFHLCNHAQEVIQLLALEYVQLTISLFGTKI